MKGIFQITWAEKKNKAAISFDIKDVSDGSIAGIPAGIQIKGSKVDNHVIEIPSEIDGNKIATLLFIKNYLATQGIEVMNYSEDLSIR